MPVIDLDSKRREENQAWVRSVANEILFQLGWRRDCLSPSQAARLHSIEKALLRSRNFRTEKEGDILPFEGGDEGVSR